MKGAFSLLLIAFFLVTFAGVALAKEMTGQVTAVDAVKGTLTVKGEKMTVGFDCEDGSIVKDVKVGDQVAVVYKEEGGKKIATKVTVKKKKMTGGY